ncbi:MAG TPA: HIT domain-containing protein [Vicinamibacterales bacterium]|nr:HIT domain-containing protein [Vicinamibacterales bacterium]
MERLWSPWRHSYVTRKGDDSGCVFCDALTTDAGRALILDEGPTCFVILNLYPYNSGHLMVVPRRHVGTLAALDTRELSEMAAWTRRAEMALTEAYEPQGINLGMNLGRPAGAGVLDHLHVHLVPRWTGDTNFMSVVGNVRVLPEELPRTAERLRPIFHRLCRS